MPSPVVPGQALHDVELTVGSPTIAAEPNGGSLDGPLLKIEASIAGRDDLAGLAPRWRDGL